jgi:hypothetical protein
MSLAVFNFLGKRKRHPPASLSQFDTETCDHSACQSLRVAFIRGPAEFEDAVSDHLADLVWILRAVEHGEHRVKRVAQEFGTDIVENGPTAMAQPVLKRIIVRLDKSVSESCDSRDGKFSPLWIMQSTPKTGHASARVMPGAGSPSASDVSSR